MGLATPTSDDDHFSVVIPPYDTFLGLGSYPESRHTVNKEAGTDVHEITLARLVKGVIKGRVTDIEPLFGDSMDLVLGIGHDVMAMRPKMLSQRMLSPLMGMIQSQRKLAFKGNGDRFNPEIGYDPKAASHCMRALWQGIRLKRDCKLFMGFPEDEDSQGYKGGIMKIKMGEMNIDLVINSINMHIELFESIDVHENLPETVDVEFWEDWLIKAHETKFGIKY